MGGPRHYLQEGGFSETKYYAVGDSITANGITAKVVTMIDEDVLFHSSLPQYSSTSQMYLKRSEKGDNEIIQARFFQNRKAICDFDWGHFHGDLEKGVVHIHLYSYKEDGTIDRNACMTRYLNNEEIKRFGPVLKKANPNVKFRPRHASHTDI
ncbi:MAG: hypothetical protein J6T67_05440 [Paludibacteraceae bacterium]|nr:hypothetical protein [Paludibacteraceae bacterium]MBP5422094.1 hypothetical protein [Paludibacteraceae bacterium]